MEARGTEDAQALVAQNAALARKVEYLENIIEAHHVTRFEENIHRLKLGIRTGIKLLATEFQVMEHDPENAKRIADLIDYMQHYIKELEGFTFPNNGRKPARKGS